MSRTNNLSTDVHLPFQKLTFPILLVFGKVLILPVLIFQLGSAIHSRSVTANSTSTLISPVTSDATPQINEQAISYIQYPNDSHTTPFPNDLTPILPAEGSLTNVSHSIDPLRLFGFLYGTFPAAPSVFVFASHYQAQVSVIATGKLFD